MKGDYCKETSKVWKIAGMQAVTKKARYITSSKEVGKETKESYRRETH